MTTTTNADNAPGEIITHNLPSYNEKNDVQGVEDAAELPFGNDAPEDEERRSSNQTWAWSLFNFNFNRCNKIILGSIVGTTLFFCIVAGLSSSALTNNSNNNMVVESFNGAAFQRDSRPPTPAPTSAKSSKSKSGKSECIPNIGGGNPTDDCDNCCGIAPTDLEAFCDQKNDIYYCSIGT